MFRKRNDMIIRATELRMFVHCSRYYFDTKDAVAKGKNTGNKFTDIGKQVHALIETSITHDITEGEHLLSLLNLIENTTVEERANTLAYIKDIHETIVTKKEPIWLERKLVYKHSDGLILSGTMDCVVEKSCGKYLLLDHKTNRRESSVEYWRNNLQSMVYAFLLQQLTGLTELEVVFGFPFINKQYRFTYDEKDLLAISWYIKYQLERFQAFSALNIRQMMPNEECKWCISRKICPVYKVVSNSPIIDLQNSMRTKETKIAGLKMQKELIDAKIEELKGE